MMRLRKQELITVVVWSKGHPLAGQEVPLGCGNGFKGIDWLTFKPWEAEILAEECARCPEVYDQNLGDALRRALRVLERANAEQVPA